MGFARNGQNIWLLGNPLPRNYSGFNAEPQATSKGLMQELVLNEPVGNISPSAVVQTIRSNFENGSFKTWRFEVSSLGAEEGIMFSVNDNYGGHTDWGSEIVLDILDDSDFGKVIVHAAKPRKIATSSFAPSERYDPDGPPSVYGYDGAPGTTIWGFRPDDYGFEDGWYRVRVRGAQRRHPDLKFLTGSGASFTLAYQIVPFGIRHEINFFPQEPSQGEVVHFEAELVDLSKSALVEGYDWNFGDSTDHASTQKPDHTYAASPGAFDVVLRVSNTDVTGTQAWFVISRQIHTFLNPVSGLRVYGHNSLA